MGVLDEKRVINLILQVVSREGRYALKIKSNQTDEDLMANKLVEFRVLTRNILRDSINGDSFEFSEGENFALAKLKGAYEFIEEEKKRLNPKYTMQVWNKYSNNALVAGLVGTIIGGIVVAIVTMLLTK